MKKISIIILLIVIMITISFGYSSWKPASQNDCNKQYLTFYNELKSMYDQAVRDKAGSPDFLADLQSLLDKYKPKNKNDIIFQLNNFDKSLFDILDASSPNEYSPILENENEYLLFTGSMHGVDYMLPKKLYLYPYDNYTKINVKATISQIDGEYMDGGFGIFVLLKNKPICFILENNRDNDGTNNYKIFADRFYENGKGNILYNTPIDKWPIGTKFNMDISISNNKIYYNFESVDKRYYYQDQIYVPFTLKDIKNVGLEFSWHHVSYKIYKMQISVEK